MLFEKFFVVTLDVSNPINYCSDKERHAMTQLRFLYEGKCLRGAYIVKILKLERISDCRYEKTNLAGEAVIDVEFSAQVIIFSRWDILTGKEVCGSQQMVVGRYRAPPALAVDENGNVVRVPLELPDHHPQAAATMIASPATASVAVGQLISVRVVVAQHQPLAKQAAVVTALLTCDKITATHRLRGSLDPSCRAEFESLLHEINLELVAREDVASMRRAQVWYFELLLYSLRQKIPTAVAGADQSIVCWENGPTWEGPAELCRPNETKATVKNVLDIASRVVAGETVPISGFWSRPLSMFRSCPNAAQSDTLPPDWPAPIEGTARLVFVEWLTSILQFLRAIREMTELYSTEEILRSHRNIWLTMTSAQTPV
jgi:hypothetical protein